MIGPGQSHSAAGTPRISDKTKKNHASASLEETVHPNITILSSSFLNHLLTLMMLQTRMFFVCLSVETMFSFVPYSDSSLSIYQAPKTP